MSQPAQCVILWITIFVATLKHRGKKGEAELRVWVSEAQDGGTDTKKKGSNQRCVSTGNKSLIGQVIMQKKRKKKKPTETWSAASAGRLEQLQGRDCSHTSYLIATDQPGCVSTHTGIFTNLDHPQHQTLSTCTQSVSFHRALLICN